MSRSITVWGKFLWQFRMAETVKKGAGGPPGKGSGVRDSEGQDPWTLGKVMPGVQFQFAPSILDSDLPHLTPYHP